MKKIQLMIQDNYQKAINFAGTKHALQKVPGLESNYLSHLSCVAMEVMTAYFHTPDFDIVFAVQLALLHDTLEDTDTTFDELIEQFDIKIANGVLALTKNKKLNTKQQQMLDSLERIKRMPNEVGLVKLADRITNLQQPPKHWNHIKKLSYLEEANLILHKLSDKNEYLSQRLKMKIEEYPVLK
jgi:(p)ppGpp synthase/HD superfamily hydrolase